MSPSSIPNWQPLWKRREALVRGLCGPGRVRHVRAIEPRPEPAKTPTANDAAGVAETERKILELLAIMGASA